MTVKDKEPADILKEEKLSIKENSILELSFPHISYKLFGLDIIIIIRIE